MFSPHGGNTGITDHAVCFQRGDEQTAEPPHLLQGEPQGYTRRSIIGSKKPCRSGCRFELFISLFLPFREEEGSVIASCRDSLNQAPQIRLQWGNLRAKASPQPDTSQELSLVDISWSGGGQAHPCKLLTSPRWGKSGGGRASESGSYFGPFLENHVKPKDA